MVISSKPFLVRGMHDWCIANEYTPHVLAGIGYDGTEVPNEYITDGQIVFNISPRATRELKIENEAIVFLANFGQKVVNIRLPMESIIAIYSHETGEGITFDEEDSVEGIGGIADYIDMNIESLEVESVDPGPSDNITSIKKNKKPTLTIIK